MKHRSVWKTILIAVLIAAIFAISPLYPYVRSLAVMRVYSRICERDSIMADGGFRIEIPGGNATQETDWYPFVMTFCDDAGFSRYICTEGARLSILYNFPAFSIKTGASCLYEENSPYYNAFYGAYVVQLPDGAPYGMSGDEAAPVLDPEAVRSVAAFDYSHLVLGDFGLPVSDFVCETANAEQSIVPDAIAVDLADDGNNTFVRLGADLTVSGAAHEPERSARSYLQYGRPQRFAASKTPVEEPFAPVTMHAVVYARYLPNEKCTVFFYAMAVDDEVLATCEEQFLLKSRIRAK